MPTVTENKKGRLDYAVALLMCSLAPLHPVEGCTLHGEPSQPGSSCFPLNPPCSCPLFLALHLFFYTFILGTLLPGLWMSLDPCLSFSQTYTCKCLLFLWKLSFQRKIQWFWIFRTIKNSCLRGGDMLSHLLYEALHMGLSFQENPSSTVLIHMGHGTEIICRWSVIPLDSLLLEGSNQDLFHRLSLNSHLAGAPVIWQMETHTHRIQPLFIIFP